MVASPVAIGQVYHPHGDPLDFDPDWQWFAPVDEWEMEELQPRQRANHGWFGAYDRTYLWLSRPATEQSANTGDFGWGNRYDFGWMGEDDHGWLFSFRNMSGPNVYDRLSVTRIDRVNADDTGDPLNPIFPPEDRNDPQLLYRVYVLGDSLNVGGLSNFELNRTWRKTPYRYGGILEPMIGFKYSTFDDQALNQYYDRDVNQIGTPGGVLAFTGVETLTSDLTLTKNQMVGGQFGARYFNHNGRWTWSGELRAFGMANFQTSTFSRYTETTEYDGLGGDVVITDAYTGSITFADTNTEFVFGFEARAEGAYYVTKYLEVRGGIDVINFAKGIWRGANPTIFSDNSNIVERSATKDQTQDVQLAGFTFGITLNR